MIIIKISSASLHNALITRKANLNTNLALNKTKILSVNAC